MRVCLKFPEGIIWCGIDPGVYEKACNDSDYKDYVLAFVASLGLPWSSSEERDDERDVHLGVENTEEGEVFAITILTTNNDGVVEGSNSDRTLNVAQGDKVVEGLNSDRTLDVAQGDKVVEGLNSDRTLNVAQGDKVVEGLNSDRTLNVAQGNKVVEGLNSDRSLNDAQELISPPRKKSLMSPPVKEAVGLDGVCKKLSNCSPFDEKKKLVKPLDTTFQVNDTNNDDFGFQAIDWDDAGSEDTSLKHLSPCVVAHNLPDLFVEEHFKIFLSKVAWKKFKLIKPTAAVHKIENYDESSNSCRIVFISAELAAQFCTLDSLLYDGEYLRFTSDEVTDVGTSVVLVTNLPDFFSEGHFKKFLNKLALEERMVQSPSVAVKEVTDYLESANFCKVEFTSAALASKFCGIRTLKYEDVEVFMTPDEKMTQPCELSASQPCELSAYVKVQHLPELFFERHFIGFLNKRSWLYSITDQPKSPVKAITEHISATRSCRVEFLSPEIATKMCMTQPILYDGDCDLLLTQESAELSSVTEVPDVMFYNSEEGASSSTCTDFIPHGVTFRNDWPTYESLKLLEICIRHRDLLRSSATRKVGEGYRIVVKEMMAQGLYYSLFTIKKHLKSMLLSYHPQFTTFEFHAYIAEFVGDAPLGSSKIVHAIQNCKREAPPKKKTQTRTAKGKTHCGVLILEDSLIEDNGHKFTKESDLLLIAEYEEKKYLLDDDKHSADEVYEKMKKVFHQKGYTHLNSSDLSTRIAYLASQFKKRYDAVLNLTGTGSEARKWTYYDEMAHLLEGSVVCKPQKLVSVGSQNLFQVRDEAKPSKKTSSLSPTESYKSQRLVLSRSLVNQVEEIKEIVSKSLGNTSAPK